VSRWWIVVAAVCGAGFAVLTVAVGFHPEPFGVDRAALRTAEDLRTPWLTALLTGITTAGSSPWLVAIALVVGLAALGFRRDPLPGAWLLAEYVGAVVLYQSLKAVLDRARPPGGLDDATGAAFPSGHATQGIAFFGLLAVILLGLVPRGIRLPAAVGVATLGILSGLSRVYLGVHWLTDVAGGFLLGGAWLAIMLGIRASFVRRQEARASEVSGRDGGPPPGEPPPVLFPRSDA
jgi:undecaprenyl-diphosphatase